MRNSKDQTWHVASISILSIHPLRSKHLFGDDHFINFIAYLDSFLWWAYKTIHRWWYCWNNHPLIESEQPCRGLGWIVEHWLLSPMKRGSYKLDWSEEGKLTSSLQCKPWANPQMRSCTNEPRGHLEKNFEEMYPSSKVIQHLFVTRHC